MNVTRYTRSLDARNVTHVATVVHKKLKADRISRVPMRNRHWLGADVRARARACRLVYALLTDNFFAQIRAKLNSRYFST